jgi:hypothetical protein
LRSNRFNAAAMISSDRLRFCFALRGREISASNISIRGSGVSRRRFSSFSVDRDEDRLAQRIGQQRMQLLFAAAAGVARLPPLETGVQRRAAGARLVIVLVVRHMRPFSASAIRFCRLSQRIGIAICDFLSYEGGIVNMANCYNGN